MRYKSYRLDRSQVLPKPLNDVFLFFADAGNLELITPQFLHFRILTPLPIRMEPGALIDYRLRLFSLPFHWRTRIEMFEPGRCFTDVQVSGPYRRWHHLHEFTAVLGGTLVHDVVDYELPLGPLGALVHALFVRRTLETVFDYRRERIGEIFGKPVL
ncbi:MAG: SRPBCC family protein [Candidatus Binatia bacterium]